MEGDIIVCEFNGLKYNGIMGSDGVIHVMPDYENINIRDTETINNEIIITDYYKYLYYLCPDLSKIFDEYITDVILDIINKKEFMYGGGRKAYETNKILMVYLKDRYIIIKGHVQSGKTNFIICSSMMCLSVGFSIVIILRNTKADHEQMYKRLTDFKESIERFENRPEFNIIRNGKHSSSIDKTRIFLVLCNEISTEKIVEYFKDSKKNGKYVLIIDEVDYVDSSINLQKNKNIKILKDNAHCVFGVSATIMDPIGKEKDIIPKDIILLTTPIKYIGIDNLSIVEISDKCVYSSKDESDLFANDLELNDFICCFSKQKVKKYISEESIPNICLINICRSKNPYIILQQKISKLYPNLTTIVYNGDGIIYRKGNLHEIYKYSISSFLQKLKDNGGITKHPNIIIFAGELSGRGISFVSDDYIWHLTHQRLLVSKDCDEPELIQKIRLCGLYNNSNRELLLYSTKKILDDLVIAYFKQEEILCNLKSLNDTFEGDCKSFIEKLPINKDKISKRKMIKDLNSSFNLNIVNDKVGWNMNVYIKKELPPAVYYECYSKEAPCKKTRLDFIKNFIKSFRDINRTTIITNIDPEIIRLVKLFPKWATKQTKIALFLQNLDPNKMYTSTEFKKMCKDREIVLSHLLVKDYAESSGYGIIIEKVDDHYRLRKELVSEFIKHF